MTKNSKFNLSSFIQFLQTDIWRIRAKTLSGHKFFWIRQLRMVLLALRGFDEDKCGLRASALTFFSLLSVVPVVAMAFGIAKGFGFEKVLEEKIMAQLQGQQEVATKIITFAQSFLQNTSGGVIAGVGIAILFWTIIKVLGNIEDSFNDIWGIKKARSIGRKFSDYLSIMLICPVLFIMSSSAMVLITSQITLVVSKLAFLGPVGTLILTSLRILPYVVIWCMFTFIYIFMPNTKVNFRSGLMAGIIAGTIYQIVQWAYIRFQIGVSNYGAIYGSFAALPLFLMWLQVSWLVVLLGAEISFTEQNVDTYEFEADSLKVSYSFKKLLALNITYVCVKMFHLGQRPPTANEISRELEIPIRLVNQVIFDLTEAGVLAEVKINGSQEFAYHPARDLQDLTIQNVVDMLDRKGIDTIPVAQTETFRMFKNTLARFHDTVATSPANILLKDVQA